MPAFLTRRLSDPGANSAYSMLCLLTSRFSNLLYSRAKLVVLSVCTLGEFEIQNETILAIRVRCFCGEEEFFGCFLLSLGAGGVSIIQSPN